MINLLRLSPGYVKFAVASQKTVCQIVVIFGCPASKHPFYFGKSRMSGGQDLAYPSGRWRGADKPPPDSLDLPVDI